MFNKLKLIPAAALALVLAGCSDSNDRNKPDEPPPPPATFRVQALHASPDAPKVNLSIGTSTINNVDYKDGTGALQKNVGTYTVKVDGIVPGGTATVIAFSITLDVDSS